MQDGLCELLLWYSCETIVKVLVTKMSFVIFFLCLDLEIIFRSFLLRTDDSLKPRIIFFSPHSLTGTRFNVFLLYLWEPQTAELRSKLKTYFLYKIPQIIMVCEMSKTNTS